MQGDFVTQKPDSAEGLYSALMHAGGRPAKQPRTDLGARIAQARERAGFSQGDVAAKMDVSQQVVAAWERKAKALRTDTLIKLAAILNASADELLGIRPARHTGPTGRVRQVFDAVAALPRRQQQKIVDVVEAFVEKTAAAR